MMQTSDRSDTRMPLNRKAIRLKREDSEIGYLGTFSSRFHAGPDRQTLFMCTNIFSSCRLVTQTCCL
ncbi:hypothetical protein MPTK1_8g12320 [Marchantia polymorpha subsp. ruderalis]|uniref:Uncharacterized protein n=1 Tax=Marchantia polymorpha TaxID=3197 RepID=A0A2R6WJU4_MARPO|nr:hypothetical protein MARPO_0083s0088 [Marchantia polymorpha]BBN19637.1 hypothetical protein Mp_8g12320 [Marchantia polymorpha subsp. ruderalis]|eukprot:PTQ34130.1 hypothetical protein MARPO_0083s0088 [Marchantia polymorpha]